MAEKKKSRLKLKTKKPNSDKSVRELPERESIVTIEPTPTKLSNKQSLHQSIQQQSDIIHIIHDDEDTSSTTKIPKPLVDKKLKDLQEKLLKFKFPVCDIWSLEDLPSHNPSNRPHKEKSNTGKIPGLELDELLPLPKFSKEYLTSKRPECDLKFENLDQTADQCHEQEEDLYCKRKISTDSLIETKKLKTDIPKSNTFIEVQHGDSSGSTISEKNVPVSSSKSCPICTVQFAESMNQLDIDTHIAVCLSMTGDDVDW